MTVDPSRRRALAFHGIVAVGILIGAGTTIAEIVDRPPVQLGEERDSRDDGVSRVQVLADNQSEGVAYCVEIRVGAFDAEGLDLQDEVVAEPRQGEGRLRPGQSVNFVASLEDISDQELREELDEFVAYVAEREPC
jgi:hypothetical protein